MADEAVKVRVDLHPMYDQVLANIALLEAGSPADDVTSRALEVLKNVDNQLRSIFCGGMGVFVYYRK
jgi:hypothetical protein